MLFKVGEFGVEMLKQFPFKKMLAMDQLQLSVKLAGWWFESLN